MAKPVDDAATGGAMAAAMYSLLFAPLGAQLGTAGGLLVDAAARSCANAPHDALAEQFSQFLAQAQKDARP